MKHLRFPLSMSASVGSVEVVAVSGGGYHRKSWKLPRLGRSLFGWRPLQLALVILCVTILVLSSENPGNAPSSHSTSLDSNLGNPFTNLSTVYYPYLAQPSQYPTPDALTNESGSVSFPQLATVDAGNSSLYIAAFALDEPGYGWVLALQTGRYNATLAQNIFLYSSLYGKTCFAWCSGGVHLPIMWGAAVPIAAYGAVPIQGVALATSLSDVFVAATTNNSTAVYYSQSYGAQGTW